MSPETNSFPIVPRAHARSASTLSSAVCKRLNRLAHSQALQYEQALRTKATLKLQNLASSGASEQELLAEMDRIFQHET